MEYIQFIVVAILIEALWENIRMIWQDGKFNINATGSLILSIAFCLLARIDIFPVVDLYFKISFIGCAMTGILLARGSNFIHDLLNRIRGNKNEE